MPSSLGSLWGAQVGGQGAAESEGHYPKADGISTGHRTQPWGSGPVGLEDVQGSKWQQHVRQRTGTRPALHLLSCCNL